MQVEDGVSDTRRSDNVEIMWTWGVEGRIPFWGSAIGNHKALVPNFQFRNG